MAVQHWWDDPLAQDMHNHLLNKELQLPPFNGNCPHMKFRRAMVDWLATLCEHFELCLTAKHLTVALYDFFVDKAHNIPRDGLHLVGLGCLLVAGESSESIILQQLYLTACVQVIDGFVRYDKKAAACKLSYSIKLIVF